MGAKAAFLVALGHGFASSALFCLVGIAQERRLTRNPFFVTGLRTLGRGAFLLVFFVFFARNGAPPFFSFWGELGTVVSIGLNAGPVSYLTVIGAGVICPTAYFIAYFRGVRGRPTVRLSPVVSRNLLILSVHLIILVLFFFGGGCLIPY